ncbi:MAG: DUF1801 domain-containing protein [Kofleriaceae bacterium]|nr:DUF1801 domain-containing protein [Kofleriaceae bacterium]
MKTQSAGATLVDKYLAGFAGPPRATLEALRATLLGILPHATEDVKYGMPAVVLGSKAIAGYAGFKEHCSYFPHSSNVLVAAGRAVAKYPVSKGGLRFPVEKPLPVGLVKKLVKLRLAELADVDNGPRFDYYDDGQLKATGQMKHGQLHGTWKWFRKDGTLMRTGQFARGAQVGTWETFDAHGKLVKTTKL